MVVEAIRISQVLALRQLPHLAAAEVHVTQVPQLVEVELMDHLVDLVAEAVPKPTRWAQVRETLEHSLL